MRYVTHYTEYPIYEPAEGGYYYSGNEVESSDRMSKRKARATMEEIWSQCEAENAENLQWEERTGKRFDYWVRSADGNEIWKTSRYIGEGESYVVERHKGSQIRGRRPYC